MSICPKATLDFPLLYICSFLLATCFSVLLRITEWVRLEVTGGHLVQLPCSSRVILEHIAQNRVQMFLEYFQ